MERMLGLGVQKMRGAILSANLILRIMKRYIVNFIRKNEFVRTFWVTASNIEEARLYAGYEKETFCNICNFKKNSVRIEIRRG